MVSVEGEETGEFTLPSSGGFSSSASDWLHAPSRGEDREPVLLELPAGERTVRMTNVDDNGVYMDYLLFCAASTKPSVKPM